VTFVKWLLAIFGLGVDNVAITAGAGTSIATDDVAGTHFQQVKLVDGTADSSTRVAAGGGVEANALRVTLASDSTGVVSVDDNGGTLSVDDAGASLSVDDNAGSLTVDNPTLSVTGGGVEATALRVTLASDSTGVVSVDDNGGSLTVDGTVAVSGAVDTELTTADLDTGAGTDTRAVVGLVYGASGGGVLVSTTNPLPVADNGGSLTVDGTVTANAGTGTFTVGDGGSSLTVDGTVTANAGTGNFTVVGPAADGAAVSGNPVRIAGKDNAGNTQDIVTSTTGILVTGQSNSAGDGAANTGEIRPLSDTNATGYLPVWPYVFNGTSWDRKRGNTTGAASIGGLAHDAANTAANNPQVVGFEAIAHGTNPTAVAAADVTKGYANRAGVPFVMAGHPNIVTIRANYTAAQTDTAIVTIGAGTKIVVTRCSVTADNSNSVDVAARVGFGATNTPTTTGVVLSHPGIAAGSGVVEGAGAGILGVGADGEDLRITSEVPTGGSIDVVVSYYTIES
jgi:hypothetical protein